MTTKAPSGLGKAGRYLWATVNQGWLVHDANLSILEEACRVKDQIARLDEIADRDGLLITGARGQLIRHPALAMSKQLRLAFAALIRQLQLTDPYEEDGD